MPKMSSTYFDGKDAWRCFESPTVRRTALPTVEGRHFWQQAVALIDLADSLLQHIIAYLKSNLHTIPTRPPALRHSSVSHSVTISAISSIVAASYAASTSVIHRGLTTAKRVIHSPFLGPINICRDHDYRRNAFCGLVYPKLPSLKLPAWSLPILLAS
jgi:hypothetical protein